MSLSSCIVYYKLFLICEYKFALIMEQKLVKYVYFNKGLNLYLLGVNVSMNREYMIYKLQLVEQSKIKLI